MDVANPRADILRRVWDAVRDNILTTPTQLNPMRLMEIDPVLDGARNRFGNDEN
jgi:hypothetical protein